MGSYLKQLSSKTSAASEFAYKHGSVYYKNLLENNKQYIDPEPTVQKCQELSKKLFYTRLASIPGRYESFWKEIDYMKNAVKRRQDLTVEDLGVGLLFAAECYAWFCVGEIVGRGFTLTGYYP
ncbi:hypothetical protein KP509_13G090400 [Ceratopteris richardii]|uniref:Mitochondrial ATP synthase subunit G protein n=1 Tax=Ceratopteris richardii TaxID=49495 RepID=A0A8T2TK32_CERRI|nr:hypothetical protein KP509_13G090400 [Ceratopteris richardii]